MVKLSFLLLMLIRGHIHLGFSNLGSLATTLKVGKGGGCTSHQYRPPTCQNKNVCNTRPLGHEGYLLHSHRSSLHPTTSCLTTSHHKEIEMLYHTVLIAQQHPSPIKHYYVQTQAVSLCNLIHRTAATKFNTKHTAPDIHN